MWILQLFLKGTKVEIPGFPTENAAHMSGIFLQMANDYIALFEVKEVINR